MFTKHTVYVGILKVLKFGDQHYTLYIWIGQYFPADISYLLDF